MKINKPVIQNLCIFLGLLVIPPLANSETQFSLPRATNGLGLLLGIGPSYDETAFIGEETSTEASIAMAIMTENFYLDFHEISYRKSLSEDLQLKIFGTQDGLPSENDKDILSIKSGESFDLGLSAEKKSGFMRVGALIATDVTGTHNGYKLELSAGKDVSNARSKFGFTVGGRYEDRKRSNYYFGVTEDEALSNIPAYNVDGQLAVFANAIYVHQLTQHIGLWAAADMTTIGNQAKNSPRIDGNAEFAEIEASIGLAWQFSVHSL